MSEAPRGFIEEALDDMRAGCPITPDKAAGMRAALRAATTMLDEAARRLTPAGKRTNQVDRHTADVLRWQADKLNALRDAVKPDA